MVLAPAPKICRPISQHQIAIEPAAAGYSPFRDFVHCRFADAGRRWVWLRSPTAGIRKPFGGPEEVLRYLSRYTHRVAICNRRLISAGENGVTFRYKDYRLDGTARYKTTTLATGEFIRRFLIHVLPKGFHRIRHYGLLAKGNRAANITHARELLAMPSPAKEHEP